MDIKRFLGNEPIIARPPSPAYWFQKLARRNMLAFGAATAVTTALLLGLGACAWLLVKERAARLLAIQARQDAEAARQKAEANEKRVQREAAKSQPVAGFLKDMLKGVEPSVAVGRDTTMLQPRGAGAAPKASRSGAPRRG
jgi:hypothetical protein